ncbi:MAG: multidrug ABC transporter ATP-binding protein [Bdellovibrionaceae bacterium]|nr:multidrug ABC transporter ATP-binding protein [Pseudobdellovibrionaceae bacterium]|tara:strand:+ start:1670 stop:2680 length:1011 start_codon:yes stop_codon:yes gene_type:complete
MTPIISVRNVTRSFQSTKKEPGFKGSLKLLLKPKKVTKTAVHEVSFEIKKGSFVGLIGANGAGKTTLLKILSGLIPPTSGEVKVLGSQPFKRTIEFRKKIALVMGQKAQLWWDLPARDAFDLIQAIYEIPEKIYQERLHTLTEILNVNSLLHTQIRRLSLGERMKMELIGAILHWPEVIYLDEPTIGLDLLAAHHLREFLKVHNEKEKATIILTSHNMDDIEQLCSRIMIMKEGKLIFDGDPEQLTKTEEKRLRLTFKEDISQMKLQEILNLDSTKIIKENDRNFLISLEPKAIADTLATLMKQTSVHDIGIENQSLETVIQNLYTQSTQITGFNL